MEYKYLRFIEAFKRDRPGFKEMGTNEEVDELEEKWGVKLPLSYRELILLLGKYAGFGLDQRNTFNVDEFQEMQQEAIEIANDYDMDFMVKEENIFVFSCFGPHGNFCFFKLDEGDDPPVYEYMSGRDKYVKTEDHFSNYVNSTNRFEKYV